jgi:hypothetical protein
MLPGQLLQFDRPLLHVKPQLQQNAAHPPDHRRNQE